MGGAFSFKMRKLVLFLLVLLASIRLSAQSPLKFEKEIIKFEQSDSINPPKKQQVLFIGSSSFRLWSDFSERFKEYAVINRGFGGAEISDVTHYANRILIPYRPSKVFIYAGENDIGNGQSPDQVYKEFLELFELISAKLPHSQFYNLYCSYAICRVQIVQHPAVHRLIAFGDKHR